MYRVLLLVSLLAVALSYAKEYNWRNLNAVTGVANAGSCQGATMVIAAVKLYETEYYRQTTILPSLSVEHALECSGVTSCDVSSITHQNLQALLEWQRDNGLADGTTWPYSAGLLSTGKPNTTGICTASKIVCPSKVKLHKKNKISKSGLKHWIAKNPTANLIYADDAFRTYTASDLTTAYQCSNNSPKDSELNHGLNAIGYDSNSDFIVENTLGTGWGNNGYALLKNNKACGLKRRVYRYNWNINLAVSVVLALATLLAF